MTTALDFAVRSGAVVLAGLVVHAALRRRSAAVRHFVLAAALLAAAAVVPLSRALPAWDVVVLSGMDVGARHPGVPVPHSTIDQVQTSTDAGSGLTLLAIVWAAGSAIGAFVLLAGIGRLVWIGSRAKRAPDGPWQRAADRVSATYGLTRQIVILHTEAPGLLATWGLFRPKVLLPPSARNWSEERAHVVLSHELAHIRRHDWLVQLGAELLRVFYWFNPLLWVACARLRRESEQACDDAVLATGVAAHDYAGHLLALATSGRGAGSRWAAAMPMARSSTLERRIAAMLNPDLNRQALSRRASLLTAIALLAVTLPTAAFRAAQNAPVPLAGSVFDTSGAVLPEVRLTLIDSQEARIDTTTDAQGRFEFPPVPPGHYVLEAGLAGFRPLRHEFDLSVARDWHRDVTLQVGDVQETISVSERRAPSTKAPAAAGPAPIRVGGNIKPPMKVKDVHPIYPQSMIDAGLEGLVPLEATIGRDGSVVSVRVLSAQIHPDLAAAATTAVRQWRFEPTLLNGEPVEVRMKVSISFRLSD